MNIKKDIKINLELTGPEFDSLRDLVVQGTYRLEDFVKELNEDYKANASIIQSHQYRLEFSKKFMEIK